MKIGAQLLLLSFLTVSFISCKSNQALLGKWETIQKIHGNISTENNSNLVSDIKKEDWFYATWEFTQDSLLIFGRDKGAYLDTIRYHLASDTIFTEAKNGFKSFTPIIKLEKNELRLKMIDFGTNIIYVFKRMK